MTLPQSTCELLRNATGSRRHPGLLLDKFSPPGDQEKQRDAIKKVCEAHRDSALLKSLRERRTRLLQTARAQCFQAITAGPLTLHLARASALENAGIHLHPVYGFACLPGSGLKGMARAYAETIWRPGQSDPKEAWKKILEVFGWSPGTDARKKWKPNNAETPFGSQTGAVVFHEAWPTKWPRLELDIANSHHGKYYGGDGKPGDWDSPNPISFLSVSMDTVFDFAVSLRGTGSDDLLGLACEWLQGALVHEGAGAKTHAGYGRFRPTGSVHVATPPKQARSISRHRLKLVTPAFLAGAEQEKRDCDLRPATLRGLLRWWWRTMHVAHLATDDLRRLETAIWGSAEQGAALALAVQWDKGDAGLAMRPAVHIYDKQEIKQKSELPKPAFGKTTQGLFYASYGMDEKRKRYYAAPGATWNVVFSARKGALQNSSIEASEILRQGEAALWLLCRYGGVGSKARKGFGSFADIPINGIRDIEDCKRVGKELRQKLGLTPGAGSEACSSLDNTLEVLEISTPWTDRWFALDQLGAAAQRFAQQYKHQASKAALGLPRKIHGPMKFPLKNQNPISHRQPTTLRNKKDQSRHASPVHYHVAQAENGTLTIRMVAFPSSVLPDMETSEELLDKLRKHVSDEIEKSARENARKRQKSFEPEPVQSITVQAGTHFPKAKDRVRATLLEEKTKKGAWRARHDDSELEGVIQNHQEMPADCTPGQQVDLLVAFCNPNEPNENNRIAFRWPLKESNGNRGKARNKGPRGGKSRRHR